MGKNIRETILLLVLFVFVILILKFTSIHENKEVKNIQLPTSCNILVRIDIHRISKKILLSELYSSRASTLFKNLFELDNDNEDNEGNNPYIEFIDHLEGINNPLELLALKINKQNLYLLRGSSSYKSNSPLLYSSKDNFLYLQLYGSEIPRKDVLKAINETKSYKLDKPSHSDIEFYENMNQKLQLNAYINTSSEKINLHIKQKINGSNSLVNLKPAGLHIHAPYEVFNFLNDNNTIENISVNYFGLNIYETANLFPNSDILITFKDSITIDSFQELVKSTYKPKELSISNHIDGEGSLLVDDIAFNFKCIYPNKIFLSTNNRKMNLSKDSTSHFEFSGDISQLFKINNSGWKGIIANEIISSVPFLNELKLMMDHFKPITTKQEKQEYIITFQLEKKHSIYAYLFSILTKV